MAGEGCRRCAGHRASGVGDAAIIGRIDSGHSGGCDRRVGSQASPQHRDSVGGAGKADLRTSITGPPNSAWAWVLVGPSM